MSGADVSKVSLSLDEWLPRSLDILDRLTNIFEELEVVPENREFFLQINILLKDLSSLNDQFSQNTVEMERFSKLLRIISKYCLRIHDAAILNICVAILYDGMDILKKIADNLKHKRPAFVKNASFDVFAARVRWLKGKMRSIEGQLAHLDSLEADKDIEVSLESLEKILSQFEM